MQQSAKKSAQEKNEKGSAGNGTVGFAAPVQTKTAEQENLLGSLSGTSENFQPVVQQQPNETVNGIKNSENNAVRELSGGKVDLHEAGASVQQTTTSDSRLESVGARSMAVGGEALIGDNRDRGHEIWHLAQQHMGMVEPTTTVNNTPVNDNPQLEKDADDYGAKIMQAKWNSTSTSTPPVQRKKSGTVQKKSSDVTQRQITRGADQLQYNINLTRTIMQYLDYGTTFVSLNGVEFPLGDPDNALTGPAFLVRNLENGNVAISIASEPINTVSSRVELPSAPPWTSASTLGYINVRLTGTGDGFSISPHILDGNGGAAATLEFCGLPDNQSFANLVVQHELHHVNDLGTAINAELRPWDYRLRQAFQEGLEINRGTLEEAQTAFYEHLGGTPTQIGRNFKNRLRIMGQAFHLTHEGSAPQIENMTAHETAGGYWVRVYLRHPMG